MLPSEKQMLYCIMIDGEIWDGAGGLAISQTEMGAWERVDAFVDEEKIAMAKDAGAKVRRCSIMVANP